MTDPNKPRFGEARRQAKERREMLAKGDLSTAFASINALYDEYAQMSFEFNSWRETINSMKSTITKWSKVVRIDRANTDAAIRIMQDFSRGATALLGDSTRYLCDECKLDQRDITDVVDDTRFSNLLRRIAGENALTALKLTHDAYRLTIKTIGEYTSKMIGIKRKIELAGATEAEKKTSWSMLMRFERILEILRKRKDTLVQQNLTLRREIEKFCKANTTNPERDRLPNKKEEKALKGLV